VRGLSLVLPRFGGHRFRHELLLEHDGAEVAQRRVAPMPIVPVKIAAEGSEEALDHGVVPAVAGPAHAGRDPMLVPHAPIDAAAVVHAAVGVEDQAGCRLAVARRLARSRSSTISRATRLRATRSWRRRNSRWIRTLP